MAVGTLQSTKSSDGDISKSGGNAVAARTAVRMDRAGANQWQQQGIAALGTVVVRMGESGSNSSSKDGSKGQGRGKVTTTTAAKTRETRQQQLQG